MSDWRPVALALLGSWPDRVAAWGPEALAAYSAELEARGVSPEAALVAIRSCPADQRFPPAAPELAALARRDPMTPTFEEALAQIRLVCAARTVVVKGWWGAGERDRLDEQARCERAQRPDIHPLVASFVKDCGAAWLRGLGLDDPENRHRQARRVDLEKRWTKHAERIEEREVAALAGRHRRGLARPDVFAALNPGGGS